MDTDLNTIRQELETWRRQRSGRSGAVPIELRTRVVGVLDHYKWAEVRQELQLSSSTISRWRKECRGEQRPQRPSKRSRPSNKQGAHLHPQGHDQTQAQGVPASFIEVPGIGGGARDEVVVELNAGSQLTLKIRGPLDPTVLKGLVETVIGGSPSCSR